MGGGGNGVASSHAKKTRAAAEVPSAKRRRGNGKELLMHAAALGLFLFMPCSGTWRQGRESQKEGTSSITAMF